jgi:hypothetical protein
VSDLDAFDSHALVVDWSLGDLLDDLHAVGHVAKHRVLAVESRLIDDDDEELGACAVGPARNEHGSDRATSHLRRTRLSLDLVQSARAVLRAFARVFRQRVAALDHTELDHAVEDRSVVGTLLSELDEVRDMVGRDIRGEIHDKRAGRRFNDSLFRRTLAVEDCQYGEPRAHDVPASCFHSSPQCAA